MAGLIWLTENIKWTQANWFFKWTIRQLAEDVNDPELTAYVEDVEKNNLYYFDLGDFDEQRQRKVVDFFVNRYVDAVVAEIDDWEEPATETSPGWKPDSESFIGNAQEAAVEARTVELPVSKNPI